MSSHALRCPACAQSIEASDVRCRACGVVLSEDNLCERCHVVMPAVERQGTPVCSACAAPRAPLPGLVVVTSDELSRGVSVGVPHGAPMFAVTLVTLGLGLGSLLAGDRAPILRVAAGLCLVVAVSLGVRARRARARQSSRRRYELEQRTVGLAYQREGVLQRDDLTRSLDITPTEAESVLGGLVAMGRANLEVMGDGHMAYAFRDAKPTRGIRIRGREPTGPQRITRD